MFKYLSIINKFSGVAIERRLSRIPLRHLSSAPIERRGSRMPSRSSSMKNPNSNGLGLGFSVNQTQLTKPTKENKSKTTVAVQDFFKTKTVSLFSESRINRRPTAGIGAAMNEENDIERLNFLTFLPPLDAKGKKKRNNIMRLFLQAQQ